MDWEKQFRKYVWDDDKTPYFTPVAKLNRRQASNEIYVFALFLGTLFCVVAVLANTGALPHGRSFAVALYAFSVVCAAIIIAFTKHPLAAWYCGFAPVAALIYFYLFGFHPNSGAVDHVVILVLVALWLRYSWRVITIGMRFEDMPEAE
jgi:uncharacterized membrane protein